MPGASFLEALMGMHVDTSGLEEGLKKAEGMAEASTKAIAGNFNLMAAGIATAIAGTVITALEKAIKTTAEYGEEMEHLGNRMGMTAGQAATLTGVLERHGIAAGVAARSMQILAMQAKQTTDAIDPFSTKLGRTLGTLRDTSGAALNLGQVFDLARQKVAAAGSETEKLQVAQSLVGARMGGQLLPVLKLTNDEWDRQKKSVEDALGPVDKAAESAMAYKEATASLDQAIRGLQLRLGTELLPDLVKFINLMTEDIPKAVPFIVGLIRAFEDLAHPITFAKGLLSELAVMLAETGEATGLIPKGSTETLAKQLGIIKEIPKHIKTAEEEAEELAAKQAEVSEQLEKTEKQEAALVALNAQRNKLLSEEQKLGLSNAQERKEALQGELAELEKQKDAIAKRLADPTITDDTRLKLENDLTKNKVEGIQAVAKATAEQYSEEELHAKALGLVNQQTEIEFLQKRLSDANLVGDARLKIEGDLYAKKKKFEEDSVATAVKMGAITVDQEIAYRKQKSAELLGKGDVLGAASEIMKARDLAIQQADQQMEFVKKMHVVSIQSEIDYQTQKLNVVKGNAAEEMKVIGQIADLDKKLYDQRLEYALNYVTNVNSEYDKLVKAQTKGGELLSAADRQRDAARKEVEGGKMAGEVLHGGGTEAQWQASQGWAQQQMKTAESLMQMGKQLTDAQKDNVETARDILKAASGGEEVRAPGGPSPEVGSILSPMEGLATQGLARGSDIPRLDTSFTDLATRLRDVLNTNVSNLLNFGQAVGDAAKKISAITGVPLNPGAVGPGGGIVSAGSPGSLPNTGGGTATVAAPTVGPGGTSTTATPQTGVGGGGGDALITQLKSLNDRLELFTQSVKSEATASQNRLATAVEQIQSTKQQVGVTVSVDPNSGDILTTQKLLDQL